MNVKIQAVTLALALTACGSPTVPDGAPDFEGGVLSVVRSLPGALSSGRPEFIVQEQDQPCSLNFDSRDADVVLRRFDGSLDDGRGLDILPGRFVRVWTRDGIVDGCPRRGVAEVVEISIG